MAEPLKRRAFRGLVIGACASLVLALLGAMGTDQAAFGWRLLYWAAVVMPGSILGMTVKWGVGRWGGLAHRRWLEAALVALLVAVPHTFAVIVASAMMFGQLEITPIVVAEFGLAVLLVSAVLTAINYLAAGQAEPAQASAADIAPHAEPGPAEPLQEPAIAVRMPQALSERLPPNLRAGRLLAMEAEDHYVRVHTDRGSALVLMRMSDAVALLAGVPGARVHRSWWITRAAVTGSRSSNGTTLLVAQGGLTVPVSRRTRRELAAAGWF